MLSANDIYQLNKMNSTAQKVQLGTAVGNLQPAFVLKYAGTFTTLGGDANESIPVVGAVVGDLVIVQIKTPGATPRTIASRAAATDAINVVMSGDPSTDHVLEYFVLRVAA